MKALRTAQNYVPGAKLLKDAAYRRGRALLHVPHEADFYITRLISASPNETFVDIGANHGQSIESIRILCPHAGIVSYEANPRLAAKLTARYTREQNVVVRPLGLSDQAGTFTLYVPVYRGFVYDGLSSLDRQQAATWLNDRTVYRFDERRLEIREIACQVDTLDSQNLAPAFIKVDVQGLEYQVLAGGQQTLEQYRPVLLVESYLTDHRMPQLMERLGYRDYHVADGQALPGPGPSANSLLVSVERPLLSIA